MEIFKNIQSIDDLPAWLQAFAALVALILSVWAVLRAGAEERKRERLQTRAIAVAVYPEFLKLKVTVAETRRRLEDLKSRAGHLVGQSIAGDISYHTVAIPPMLERNLDRLFMLGERGGPASLQLVSMIEQYNAAVGSVSAATVMMPANGWGEGIQNLDEHLVLIDGIADKCVAEVGPLHNVIRG